jgi:hypothetical protein
VAPPPGPGTPAPEPQPLAVGSHVQGTFDGATLLLKSEPFTMMLSGQQVTRQFKLTSTGIQDEGATLIGTYQETIRGYSPEPSTVVGTFTLKRPLFTASQGERELYLPFLSR